MHTSQSRHNVDGLVSLQRVDAKNPSFGTSRAVETHRSSSRGATLFRGLIHRLALA
jgi:hypothetical protein